MGRFYRSAAPCQSRSSIRPTARMRSTGRTFFLYAAVYGALGAASEDEQHLGQLSWPVIFFLVIPMVAIGAIMSVPDSPVVVFLSLFPFTSSIVMFQRLVLGSPEPWQMAVCITLLAASIAGVMLLSARIFRVGILMTGKRSSFAEIARWLRYRG